MTRPPDMFRGEEGFGIEIPVEFAATAEVFEEFGACFQGADAVEAVVEGVELRSPVCGASPAPEGAGLVGRCGCAEEGEGGCFDWGRMPGQYSPPAELWGEHFDGVTCSRGGGILWRWGDDRPRAFYQVSFIEHTSSNQCRSVAAPRAPLQTMERTTKMEEGRSEADD